MRTNLNEIQRLDGQLRHEPTESLVQQQDENQTFQHIYYHPFCPLQMILTDTLVKFDKLFKT
jgi:hypothetical protein